MIALINEYQKELKQIAVFADETVQNYISCIHKYCEYAKEDLKIDLLKTEGFHVRQWFAHLKKTKISNARLQHHQYALKGFFTFLSKLNRIRKNPADALWPIRKVRTNRYPSICKDIVYRLLRSIDQSSWLGKRNFTMISLLWALGLRVKELTGLKVGDFEPEHDPTEKMGLLRIHGKNKKQRALFIVDKLYDQLIDYLCHPLTPKKKSHPLFPTQKDKAISKDRVERVIHEYAHRAGIKERITPHGLRHSFATEMYHQKVPLYAIQAMMGHDSMAETSVYIHVSEKLQKQALEHILISGRLSWE